MGDNRPIADFTKTELREYACEHVYYEIDMLVRSVGAATKTGERWPMNVAVEVFTIHLRNVLDFLYPPANPWPTDVMATHFFTDPARWAPTEKTHALRVAHRRAHKEVAHLTTDRKSNQADKLWDMPALCGELVPVLGEFARTAEVVCECFARDAEMRLRELPTA